ncbi:MAG: glycosyltransferase [Ruminococcus sp.]|nr:glycosyltransferase [Ruminococcus sp.]
MTKILFFIPTLSHGGAEKVLVNLVNHLNREKYDITVQALFDGGVNKQFLKPHIKTKFVFKKIFPGNSKLLALFPPKLLYKLFIKEHFDIIVSYLEGPTARIVSGCNDKDTKLVSWIHCRMESEKAGAVGFRSFKEAKKCYNKFDYTACVSQWVKDYFIKIFDFKKPIGVLYNTIETDEIIAKSSEKIDDIVFDNDTFNIISVGKIIAVKAFMRLARIHKRLIDAGIKNHIYILGVGDEQPKIEKYLDDNNLTDSFTFLGYNTNPYKYVKACDLYVCSSLSEGFSTSVTESLIVGTPVVTTLCSGMQEMLGENNEYGIVTENNEDSLYEGIKSLLDNPDLLAHYKKQAEIRGKAFSTSITVQEVEKMLEDLR